MGVNKFGQLPTSQLSHCGSMLSSQTHCTSLSLSPVSNAPAMLLCSLARQLLCTFALLLFLVLHDYAVNHEGGGWCARGIVVSQSIQSHCSELLHVHLVWSVLFLVDHTVGLTIWFSV